jgi:predicted deacylase
VWVQAQTHGDEANPTAAIYRALRGITPDRLHGSLVVAPAMHATAYRHYMRESPLDGKNGNRIWGIDPANLGHTRVFSYLWMDQTLALIRALAPALHIDMHDGGIPLRIMSHVLYSRSAESYAPFLAEWSRKTAMKVIWRNESTRFGGSVTGQMHAEQVPALMIESGGTGQLLDDDIQEMARGVTNALVCVGALAQPLAPRHDDIWIMSRGHWVRAGRAGMFEPVATLGRPIARGETIGHMLNIFGAPIEELQSPIDGIVFGLRTLAVANVGDYIANIGQRAD